ncbi:hypothetical protein RN001_013097 [Aquatica leii]|uniref:Uncharacterized protein n=1 Tax=Aquatica leii TaxID=1421715 RepID=A0AAN7SC82_9COLE|nr:hypothetical protein RN001_013097 [Aquatica leii]
MSIGLTLTAYVDDLALIVQEAKMRENDLAIAPKTGVIVLKEPKEQERISVKIGEDPIVQVKENMVLGNYPGWQRVKTYVVQKNICTINEKYFFDCWVNGKPLQPYVDSGCGAVLITKSSVDLLGLETIPCTEFIMGYGGSSIETLGKVKLNLKVDSAEAEVEALVVLNVTQNIPVLVGQTFLNNNEVVMIVAGDKVRILSAHSEIAQDLDICPGKVPLWAKTSTVIAPRTTALVLVTSRGICNSNVYVQGGLRMFPGKEHVLDGCIRRVEDRIISITNLSGQDIQVSTKNILARSTLCFEDKASISCLTMGVSSNQNGNSFSIDDIIFNEN